MRAAGAVILVAALGALTACGGGSHARRDAVNRYFDRVDAVQQPVRGRSASISSALTHFSIQRNSVAEVRGLTTAHLLFARAETRLRAVHPPADARRLHAQLIRMYTLQSAITGELLQMTSFVPRFAKALAPLKPTYAALGADLKVAKGWQPLAAAFARYRVELSAIVSKLDGLSPPATFKAAFDSQRAGLRRSIQLCTAIELALAKHDRKATATAIQALSNVGAEKGAAKARRDQIAAAKAYNARLAAVDALATRISKERDRLVTELG